MDCCQEVKAQTGTHRNICKMGHAIKLQMFLSLALTTVENHSYSHYKNRNKQELKSSSTTHVCVSACDLP